MTPDLADWIDTGGRNSRHDARRACSAGWEYARASGCVVEDGVLLSLPCGQCNQDHYAPVRLQENGPEAYCTTDGWFTPDTDAVAAVSLDLDAIMACLRAAFGLPPRNYPWRASETIIELGLIETGKAQRSLHFAKCLTPRLSLDRAIHEIDQKGSQYSGLILTTSNVPLSIRTSHGHRFVPLQEIVSLGEDGFVVDFSALDEWSTGMPRKALIPDAPGSLHWTDAAEQAWEHLHAEKQLTKNASDMGRKVQRLLLSWHPGMGVPDNPKTISDHLRRRHRAAFPGKDRRG